jgi:hypothetical protein
VHRRPSSNRSSSSSSSSSNITLNTPRNSINSHRRARTTALGRLGRRRRTLVVLSLVGPVDLDRRGTALVQERARRALLRGARTDDDELTDW